MFLIYWYHVECLIRSRYCLFTLCEHPVWFGFVFVFLVLFLFVCVCVEGGGAYERGRFRTALLFLRIVFVVSLRMCVLSTIVCVSGLSILDFYFGFL